MALTKSKASSIFTPEGNSLAVFIDVVDGAIKLKDVFGDVVPLTEVLNLTELTVDKLAFNTSYVYPSLNTGEMAWNDTEKTVDLRMGNGGGVTAHLGQSLTFPLVVNKSGGTLIAGTLVMVDPTDVAQGNRIRVVKAVSDGTYPVELMVGILNESIDNNQEGFATWFGYARDLSLTALEPVGEAWAEGDILYANPSIAGGLTKNKPNEPNWDNTICAITSINGVNLTLLVRPSLFVTTQEKMLITERLKLGADSTATTQSTAVIQSSTTNAGIAIVPNGTGAITAQVPDGTATGGNARGQYSVDLQTFRLSADQVASNNRSFMAGVENKSTGNGSVVIGLRNNDLGSAVSVMLGGSNTSTNTNSNYNNVAIGLGNALNERGNVAIGRGNTVSGIDGVAIGANNVSSRESFVAGLNNSASADHSTIGGGENNTVSTNTHATVVGGIGNTSSGQYSISGGSGSVASGNRSIAFGFQSLSNAQGAISIGQGCQATDLYSVAIGGGADASGLGAVALGGTYSNGSLSSENNTLSYGGACNSYLRGQISGTNEIFSSRSDAQWSCLNAIKSGTVTSGSTLDVDLSNNNLIRLVPLGDNRSWNVTIKWVCVVTNIIGTATGVTIGDTIVQVQTIGFKKVGGISSVLGTANTISTNTDASMSSSTMAYTANRVGAQELALTFTAPAFSGEGSLDVRIVAKLELTEVAW